MTSHYLNQWWSILPTHVCVTRSQWFKTNITVTSQSASSAEMFPFDDVIMKIHIFLSRGQHFGFTYGLNSGFLEICLRSTNNWKKTKNKNSLLIKLHCHWLQNCFHNILKYARYSSLGNACVSNAVAIRLLLTHLTHKPLGDLNDILDAPNLVIDGLDISWEITLRWMTLDLTDYESALVQIMG